MKKYILVLISCICIALVAFSFTTITSQKIAYFDAEKVYAGFELKKELERQLQSNQMSHQKLLDSFKVSLSKMKNEIESDKLYNGAKTLNYNNQVKRYLEIKESVSQLNNTEIKKYDEQILTQLQQYIKDYSISHNYDFVFAKKEDEIGFFLADNNISLDLIN